MVNESDNNEHNYAKQIEDQVSYVNSFMEIESLSNIGQQKDNSKLKSWIPIGKDLLLGDLSRGTDGYEYTLMTTQLSCLLSMQKKSYPNQHGIIPSFERYSLRLQFHMIRTRATGDSRERELHVAQHAIKNWLKTQTKPNAGDVVFGDTKNKNNN